MASVFKRGGKGNRGGYWYVSWFDHTGKRRSKCARTTDKATAERIGAKLETEAALRRDGVINAGEETVAQQSRRSIAEHLADFEAKMRAANRTAMHVSRTIAFVEQIATFANFTIAGDISADGLHRYGHTFRTKASQLERFIRG